MDSINLESILNKNLEKSKSGIPVLDSDIYENIKEAMFEACENVLDSASQCRIGTRYFKGKWWNSQEIIKETITQVKK